MRGFCFKRFLADNNSFIFDVKDITVVVYQTYCLLYPKRNGTL